MPAADSSSQRAVQVLSQSISKGWTLQDGVSCGCTWLSQQTQHKPFQTSAISATSSTGDFQSTGEAACVTQGTAPHQKEKGSDFFSLPAPRCSLPEGHL